MSKLFHPFTFLSYLGLQEMGPTSMPSVPLMVGCGVSCSALLILLLIYAAFWRYLHVLFVFFLNATLCVAMHHVSSWQKSIYGHPSSSFFFFYPVRYIRSERSIILVNFCLSILASNLLILVGQSQTLSKVWHNDTDTEIQTVCMGSISDTAWSPL